MMVVVVEKMEEVGKTSGSVSMVVGNGQHLLFGCFHVPTRVM